MYHRQAVADAGYQQRHGQRAAQSPTGGIGLAEFLPIYRRWMVFSRNGLPFSFTWRQWMLGGGFFVALGTAIAAAFPSTPVAALVPAGGGRRLRRHALPAQPRLRRRAGAAALRLDAGRALLLSPWVLAQTLLRKQVGWRGRIYEVDASAALAVGHG